MREINFRAWVLKDDEHDIVGYMESSISAWQSPLYEHEQGNIVLMQYTGKKDSNNKEIYEGDILWCESNGVTGTEKRVVCWDSYQAKFKSVPLSTYHANAGNGGWTGYDLYRTKCEVLGNIYENPELIQS